MFSHLICTSEAAGGEQHGEWGRQRSEGDHRQGTWPECLECWAHVLSDCHSFPHTTFRVVISRNTHSYLFHRGIRASRLPFQLSSARRPRSASSLTLSISNPSNSKYHYQHHSTPLNPMALVRIYAHQHTSRTAGHE